MKYRKNAVNVIRNLLKENRDHPIIHIIKAEYKIEPDEYLNRMENDKTFWGDQIMLQALANYTQRKIRILQFNTGNMTEIIPRDFSTDQELPIVNEIPLMLGHYGETHYDSLKPLKN